MRCKRSSFSLQKEAYQEAKGNLLQRKTYPFGKAPQPARAIQAVHTWRRRPIRTTRRAKKAEG